MSESSDEIDFRAAQVRWQLAEEQLTDYRKLLGLEPSQRERWRRALAAAALQGLLADPQFNVPTEKCAEIARSNADALLLELESHPLPEPTP